MVQVEKKPEETKQEEETKKEEEESKLEEKTPEVTDEKESNGEAADADADAAAADPAPPPPPQDIVLRVFMHCEGCARKVRRSLKDFPGVENVITDRKTNSVVVKGEKADPLMVLKRIQGKSRRLVELLSPIPISAAGDGAEEKPKAVVVKKEEPQILTVVLKIHMHCEKCAQEIKKRIQKVKGVESVEADLKRWEVIVKGVLPPEKLVQYVYKRFGKHSVVVEEPEVAEEKKDEEVEEVKEEEENEEEEEEKKGEGEEEGEEKKAEEVEEEEEEKEGMAVTEEEEETKAVEEMGMINNDEYYYYNNYNNYYNNYNYNYNYNPQGNGYGNGNGMEMYASASASASAYPAGNYYQAAYPPPPQLFSDENPNACTVM